MGAESVTRCTLIDGELDRQFGSAHLRLSDEALEHLGQCPDCRRLWDGLLNPRSSDFLREPSKELRGRIESAIGGTLQPVSPLPPVYMRAGLFLLLFLLVSLAGVILRGPDGFRQMSMLYRLANFLIAALGGWLLSYLLGMQMAPGSLHRFSLRMAAASLTIMFLTGAALLVPWNTGGEFLVQGWPCFRAGTLMALPVALACWLLARRGRPLSVGLLGGTLGAIAGLLGGTVLQFTCTRQEVSHLVVWHGGVIIVSAALGVLIAEVCRWMDLQRT